MASRGFDGAVLKLMRAPDYTLTVTGVRDVAPNYRRLDFSGDGLLNQHPPHPTQWIRGWFPDADGKAQQRGYTLVDQDIEADTFGIEFVLHDGPAERWARGAQIGDTLEVTVQGSKYSLPDERPSEYRIFADAVSIPAINELSTMIVDVPIRVWLEYQDEAEQQYPINLDPAAVIWVPREKDGAGLVRIAKELPDDIDAYWWITAQAPATRAISKIAKSGGASRAKLHSMAYWR